MTVQSNKKLILIPLIKINDSQSDATHEFW